MFIEFLSAMSNASGTKLSNLLSNLNSLLEVPITVWPNCAKLSAIAVPIPLDAPDIKTTSLFIIIL